jgi:UDPglucose 6-dehydrogenase
LVYVGADVPTDDDGRSDVGGVEELMAIADGNTGSDAVLVLLSQVAPGFTRKHLRPHRTLFYQVETLVLGNAVERALHPERFIVGCADPTVDLPKAYQAFLERFDCPILQMRYESAELAKIAVNVYLSASVSVANTLAEVCEGVGASWAEIVPALRLDPRIGERAYLMAGLGIAGGNLERDLATVRDLSARLGSEGGLIDACITNSRYRRDWALRVVHEEVLDVVDKPRIAVLGLAYKADTASTKNSAALALIEALGPFATCVYDPAVSPDAVDLGDARVAASALEACEGAHAVVIMTPWREFAELDPAALAECLAGRCVIDPYAVLDGGSCVKTGLHYLTLGSPPARPAGRQ